MAIQTVEQILGVPAEEVNDMLRDLLFQEVFCNGYKPTDLDFKKTARFIQRTQLNPFDGTMFARRTNLGIEIGLRIDGWLQLAKQAGVKEIIHTYSDGFLTFAEMARDVRGHEWIETTLLVSDGGRFVHREYLAENFFNTEAWCLMPNRSLGHKSTAQTIRLFTGVYVADENQASISPKDGGLTVVVDSGPAAEVEAKPAETPAAEVEAKPAETPAAEVEAKPAETLAAEVEAKPAETPAAQVEAKPAETPATQVEAKPAETPAAEVEAKPAETPAAEVEAKPAETPVVQVEADPAETPAAQVEAKPTTLEEIIKFPWGGYLPSDRLRGDVRIGFGRTVQTKQWGALRGYFKSTRMSDEDRTWVLAALDQMEAVTHG
ncbi:hypothetical protein [Aeromonas sp. D3]|uniref:hypothetical protein n=1 Tax=Aeromonas sp. D3 TaxID=2990474 RepID=UPI0022E74CBC|nr:hypothetical protein [Aeromonas sp. D3]